MVRLYGRTRVRRAVTGGVSDMCACIRTSIWTVFHCTHTHTSSVTHSLPCHSLQSVQSPSCSQLCITITGHLKYRRLVTLLLFAHHSAGARTACRLHAERRRRHVQCLALTLLSSHGRLHVVSHDAVHAHDILPHAGQLEWPATSRLRRGGAVLRHGVCASTVSSGRVAVALLWRQRRRGVTAGGGTRATGACALAARQRAARRAASARTRRRRCAATARRRRGKALHQERVQAAKGAHRPVRGAQGAERQARQHVGR